jgi:hypothetical protein
MDLIVSDNSVLKDGKDMGAIAELAFSPHGLVEDVVRRADTGLYGERAGVRNPHA